MNEKEEKIIKYLEENDVNVILENEKYWDLYLTNINIIIVNYILKK